MPGRSTFTATALAAVRQLDLRPGAPARSRRPRPAGRTTRTARAAACRARPRPRASASACGNGAILSCSALEVARERDADHVGPRRQELAELHVGGAEPGQRGREPVGGAAARRPLDQPREPQAERAGSGSRVGSIRPNTPSRANTKPARARRARWASAESRSQPPARMQRDDAAGHALERHAARSRRAHHLGERLGLGKRRIDSTR